MTEAKATERHRARSENIARILDLALDLTVDRLENIDPKERKDNVAFDRVARTAQAFLRVADEAHTFTITQQKEDAAHDQGANVRLPDDDEITRLEQRLHRRLCGQARGSERAIAADDNGKSPPPEGVDFGRIG